VALKEKAYPAIFQGRPANTPVRIWVAGCSTGEEAYSLAITLLEYFDVRGESHPVKILATDLNEAALEKAQAGVYLDNIESDVSSDRLRRFFVRADGHYHISKSVRKLCVFSRHNTASDPPFSRLDLVSCRNVLIYMDAALQRRVLPVLYYSLNPDGFLFLGTSESVGTLSDLFSAVDSKYRILSKRLTSSALPLDFGADVSQEGRHRHGTREETVPLWSALEVKREADRIVLSRYAPVGVVVDEAMTVLQFRGRTAPYLEPAPGLATLDLLRMLREGMLAEVRSALTQAKAQNAQVTREGLSVFDGDELRHISVEVIPFKVPPAGVRFFLVLFRDTPTAEAGLPPAVAPGETRAPDQHLAQVQQELTALREYLQSTIEEQESTNEELKSANEEILSADEELQSTNEELQTANEEAQSANEELVTVNEELHHRNAELARVNNDLVNVLSGVNIPIVLVSRDLRIRRFTPLTEKLFNLIPADIGRPISDIHSNLDVPDLPARIAAVIDTLAPQETEIQAKGGHWYSLRHRPYVTLDGKIDWATIVLLDIDSFKRSLEQLRQAKAGPDGDKERGRADAP
jgi:two-component system CheB/CheR fusion protein